MKAFGTNHEGGECSSQVTPAQVEGPFYPEQAPLLWEPDSDLTQVAGSSQSALGTVIRISGQIQNMQCEPIPNARIEIWQADWQGVYNHSRDPRKQFLTPDPNFQYWAAVDTGDDALFNFRTIKPGAYPAGVNWVRPAHIHVKITAPDYIPLTTQIYFSPTDSEIYDKSVLAVVPGLVNYYEQAGAAAVTAWLHQVDGVLNQVPAAERTQVILNSIQEINGEPVFGLNIKLRKATTIGL